MHILCRENRLAVRDVEVSLNPFFLTSFISFSFHIKVMTTTSYATKHKSEHRTSRMYPALTLLTPHSHPTRTTADSFSLQVTNSPSRVKYVRYLYPQKAFFKRCSPLSSSLFLLSVFISVLF